MKKRSTTCVCALHVTHAILRVTYTLKRKVAYYCIFMSLLSRNDNAIVNLSLTVQVLLPIRSLYLRFLLEGQADIP